MLSGGAGLPSFVPWFQASMHIAVSAPDPSPGRPPQPAARTAPNATDNGAMTRHRPISQMLCAVRESVDRRTGGEPAQAAWEKRTTRWPPRSITRISASTAAGMNCEPQQRLSSAVAPSSDIALRYTRSSIIA